jgi:hypothetical protein
MKWPIHMSLYEKFDFSAGPTFAADTFFAD